MANIRECRISALVLNFRIFLNRVVLLYLGPNTIVVLYTSLGRGFAIPTPQNPASY